MLFRSPVPNLVAGLAYSIALNYLNRVVRGRHIGNVIYFQGGTAYNDAVAAAFAGLLGKRITVPPYNGVVGAIGMALIARQWHAATAGQSRFRGYDLGQLKISTRDFVCKACSNICDMKEFVIEGQKSYWGDKCSDKFRKPSVTGRKPVIDDLFAYRDQLLEGMGRACPTPTASIRVGLPRAGRWRELINTDSAIYGGSDVGNLGGVKAVDEAWHGMPASAIITIPPLGMVWLAPESQP